MVQRVEGEFPFQPGGKIDRIPSPDGLEIQQVKGARTEDPLSMLEVGGEIKSLEQIDETAFIETTNKLLDHLEENEQTINSAFDVADRIASSSTTSVQELAMKNAGIILDMLFSEVALSKSFGEMTSRVTETVSSPLEFSAAYVANNATAIAAFLQPQAGAKLIKDVSDPIAIAELLFQVPRTVGKTSELIYRHLFVQEIKKSLNELETRLAATGKNESLQPKILQLKKAIQEEEKNLKNQTISLAASTLLYTPKVITHGLKFTGHLTKVAGLALTVVGGVISSVLSFMQLRAANKTLSDQQAWLSNTREKPLTENEIRDIIVSNPEIQASLKEVWKNELPDEGNEMELLIQKAIQNPVEVLLSKRKVSEAANRSRIGNEFNQKLNTLLQSDQSIDEILGALKGMGITFAERPENKATLNEMIDELHIDQYARHKETKAVLAKNALKTLSEQKQKMERGFLKLQRGQAATTFAVAVLSTVTVIVLKSLLIAGAVAIPAAAFSMTSFIGLGILLASVAIGLIYFHHKKPNYFKVFFSRVQFQLMIYSIPKAIREVQFQLKKVREIQNTIKTVAISAKIEELEGLKELALRNDLPDVPQLEDQLKRLNVKSKERLEELSNERLLEILEREENNLKVKQSQYDALNIKLTASTASSEAKLNKWEQKLKPLNKRIAEAKFADFLRQSKLNSIPGNLTEAIVDGLFQDDSYFDEETANILQNRLGVDLNQLKLLPGNEQKIVKKGIQEYLGMDDKETAGFINHSINVIQIQVEKPDLTI